MAKSLFTKLKTKIANFIWDSDLIPEIDDTVDIGSATKGIIELHFATDVMLKEDPGVASVLQVLDSSGSLTVLDCERILIDGRLALTKNADAMTLGNPLQCAQVYPLVTAQRDALAGVAGMIIYNITTDQFEVYQNGVWTAITLQEIWAPCNFTNNQLGNFLVDIVNGNSGEYGSIKPFRIPHDFNEMVSADLILAPGGSGTIGFSINAHFGKEGEAYNTHAASIAAAGYAGVTQNEFTAFDALSMLAAAEAGDMVGIKVVDRNIAGDLAFYVIGFKVLYK